MEPEEKWEANTWRAKRTSTVTAYSEKGPAYSGKKVPCSLRGTLLVLSHVLCCLLMCCASTDSDAAWALRSRGSDQEARAADTGLGSRSSDLPEYIGLFSEDTGLFPPSPVSAIKRLGSTGFLSSTFDLRASWGSFRDIQALFETYRALFKLTEPFSEYAGLFSRHTGSFRDIQVSFQIDRALFGIRRALFQTYKPYGVRDECRLPKLISFGMMATKLRSSCLRRQQPLGTDAVARRIAERAPLRPFALCPCAPVPVPCGCT